MNYSKRYKTLHLGLKKTYDVYIIENDHLVFYSTEQNKDDVLILKKTLKMEKGVNVKFKIQTREV